MAKIRLIHWNVDEATECAKRIAELGFEVDPPDADPNSFRQIRHDPPDAVVIDLSRLPSHGRDVGIWLRQTKATREIPIVFVEGAAEKVARVKQTLPDASFATYDSLAAKLAQELNKPRRTPVVPAHNLAGYSGTPLPKKLGIKANTTVHLLNAPADFQALLNDLPPGVTFKDQLRGRLELVVWFVRQLSELEKRIDALAERLPQGGGLWIAWPKKASGMTTDVTQDLVRKLGLASGLVDYKICAIDATWSGQKFAKRSN